MEDIERRLKEAAQTTRIVRRREHSLYTFGNTKLPYAFFAASDKANQAVVRKGNVLVERPQIMLPGTGASFEGFGNIDFDNAGGSVSIFAAISRLIRLPSLRYIHDSASKELIAKSAKGAADSAANDAEARGDSHLAVLEGRDELFLYSLMLYVGEMVARSAGDNVSEYLEHMKRGGTT